MFGSLIKLLAALFLRYQCPEKHLFLKLQFSLSSPPYLPTLLPTLLYFQKISRRLAQSQSLDLLVIIVQRQILTGLIQNYYIYGMNTLFGLTMYFVSSRRSFSFVGHDGYKLTQVRFWISTFCLYERIYINVVKVILTAIQECLAFVKIFEESENLLRNRIVWKPFKTLSCIKIFRKSLVKIVQPPRFDFLQHCKLKISS